MAGAVHLSATMRQLAFLVVVVASVSACKKPGDGGQVAKASAAPVPVQTVVATVAPSPDILVLTGMVQADERSEVTADTQGKVVNVMIERGQRVKMGQPVVQLDVRTAALSAREAQANLAAAKAQKELADSECARTKSLLEKGAITQSEYDRQMTQCRAAQEEVAATQARTEMMAKSVADGMVRAPFDGVVDQKNISPGEWVSPGKALFTLVKDDPLKIALSVPEAAVSAIKEGEHVDLQVVAYPGKTYGATVTRIGAEIGASRSLTVEAQIDKGTDLVPGMFAEAHVVTGQTPHVVVPREAVVQRGKLWHVFEAKDGQAVDHIVQTGAGPSPDQVAIIQGVDKGAKVIVKVPESVADGTPVKE